MRQILAAGNQRGAAGRLSWPGCLFSCFPVFQIHSVAHLAHCLTDHPPAAAKPDIFAAVRSTPACEALLKRAGAGGVLPCPEIAPPARAFVAALLARRFPDRPVVLVTDTLK